MNHNGDYIVKNINRKLLLLAGLCARIPDKKGQEKAGKLIEEIEDNDLPELVKSLSNGEKS